MNLQPEQNYHHHLSHQTEAKKSKPKTKEKETAAEKPAKVPVKEDKKHAEDDEYEDDFENDKTEENLSSIDEGAHGQQRSKDQGAKKSSPVRPVQTSASPVHNRPQAADQGNSSESTTQHHIAIPPQAHHFTFSIDLRSIKDLESTTLLNVFLRYSYPFFGSAAPILTNPPVEIRKGMEVLLPQSFCAFDFACTVQQLQDTFLRVPLLVEVWHRDKQLSKDVLLGISRLPINDIITAEKNRVASTSGPNGWRQVYSNRVDVLANDGGQQKLGEVCVVLSLEDWGPISAQLVSQQESLDTYSKVEPVVQPEQPRETAEYQAALEIEMWKESQEQMFENQLKQKEMMYMKALAEEWKKRDKEREVLMKKKLTEYAHLEDQLRKTLADLEKREKQLAANEQEVMRLKGDLSREHDRKLQEMKEASRRMKEDCDHQIELEKTKTRELDGLIERYKKELNEAEKKYKGLENDFKIYKEELNSKPEVRLQSEINLLTLEKVELERKLDAVTKSKIHYKQQWGRALKELARLKQKEQATAKAELKRQQQELEHMRLRYLAAEEKEVVKSDKKELEDIKNELNRLKQLEEEKGKSSAGNSPREFEALKPEFNSSIDEHITRLIEERDTLLRTGVYTTQDKIISELDRQIRDCLVQKKTNAL